MNDLFNVTAVVTNDVVVIYCAVAGCVESASCTVTYSVTDGDRSSPMTEIGMTSDCSSPSSRNIHVTLSRLPANKRYNYNVTVIVDGIDLPVAAQGTFQIGM